MSAQCVKCGTDLAALWGFCPHCGAAALHEPVKPQAHEDHPARGAFGGMVYGLIAAPILIFPGVMLCLLGWGVVFGVPMIVAGILAPLAGPLFGMGEHRGECPACGTAVLSIADGRVHACPSCNAQFGVDAHAAAEAR
jgi:predicted amidophosphoribosyltransferase